MDHTRAARYPASRCTIPKGACKIIGRFLKWDVTWLSRCAFLCSYVSNFSEISPRASRALFIRMLTYHSGSTSGSFSARSDDRTDRQGATLRSSRDKAQ